MPEKKHSIILIKNAGKAFLKVKEILATSKISSEVTTLFVSPSELQDCLEQKSSTPPSFVICFTDSENNYKNIFIKVKEEFPETRRMLIVESNEREKIIDSLNKDEIHFCLALPFDDSDFLEQIKYGFNEVEQGNTWEYTKRIVNEQNIKMYKIAKSFKEKDDKYLLITNKKKQEYQDLKSELEKLKGISDKISSLEEYIDKKNISLEADGVKSEFETISGSITKVFNEIASKNSIDFLGDKDSDILRNFDQYKTANAGNVEIISNLICHALNINAIDSKLDSNKVQNTDPNQENNLQINATDSFGKELEDIDPKELVELLGHAFEFTMDDDRLKMQIQIKDKDSELVNVKYIFEYLREVGVSYGLISEQTLLTWLGKKDSVQQLIVAKGTSPEQAVDGTVTYHFNTNFIHAGQVKADGSIDFRERGKIPFVEENVLLAEKTPAKLGKPGVDISGAQIAVEEPADPIFVAGDNTFESEGGMKIYAKTGGQPHLNAMGAVSVAPVLNIDSDVDYETGNISFKGSIIVNGTIKEGFKVEGTNLTAEQIEGAQIHINGDLNVGAGIIDSDIIAQGNIQTKYINNTKIESFGDLIVTTEVLDSKIDLTGKFDGGKARIIGSEIVAKGGVEASQIGTTGSKPNRIRVGADDYIIKLIRNIDKKLIENKEASDGIKKYIDGLNKQDQKHFKSVSESAYVQDRTQLKIKSYKKKASEIEGSGLAAEAQAIQNEIIKLEEKAADAEKMVENALDQQDKIAEEIKVKEAEIEKIEEKNISLVNEKKALKECSDKGNALARVIVNGKVTAGTRVESINSSLTLRDDTSRCKIEEIGMGSGGVVQYYEMLLVNL
ncbi:MAG: DUF342 domain-containing protein [Desulfobacterales bacterium]|nr:DUF342 domain-containing protein [Desulfobacterales bacterium]